MELSFCGTTYMGCMHSLNMVAQKVRQLEGREEEVGRKRGEEGAQEGKGQPWVQNHAAVPQMSMENHGGRP